MLMARLSEIAECLNGFTFRAKPHDSPAGGLRVIQVGDVQLNGLLDVSVSPRIEQEVGYKKFILKEGDVIFRGRAGVAAALVCKANVPIMAASPLVIIKVDKKRVFPEYVTWYLNSIEAQRYFNRASQGTLIKAVGIKELTQLELPLPPLEIQKEIIQTAELSKREQGLLEEIRKRKEKLTTQMLLNTAHQQSKQRKST